MLIRAADLRKEAAMGTPLTVATSCSTSATVEPAEAAG